MIVSTELTCHSAACTVSDSTKNAPPNNKVENSIPLISQPFFLFFYHSNFLGRVERGVSSNLQLKTLDKIISALEIDYPTFFSFNIETADKKTRIMNKLSLSSQQDEILDVIDSILDIEKNKNN